MEEAVFKQIVEEEWGAVPPPYQGRIKNVALLIEDEPNEEVREKEGLEDGETLLGIYQGIPQTERGEGYGIGPTLPDTITIYRLPTLEEAKHVAEEHPETSFPEIVRRVVRDTIWHEVGHYFGHGEEHLEGREDEGSNEFKP